MGTGIGCVLAVVCLSGYGVLLLYFGLFPLMAILVVAEAMSKLPHFKSWLFFYLMPLTVISLVGALLGQAGRQLYCLRKCQSCEPILAALDDYRQRTGHYPKDLEEDPAVSAALRRSGLSIGSEKAARETILPLNAFDALLFLEENKYTCGIGVTKKLPFSFTRYYVYVRTNNNPVWEFRKVVWYADGLK